MSYRIPLDGPPFHGMAHWSCGHFCYRHTHDQARECAKQQIRDVERSREQMKAVDDFIADLRDKINKVYEGERYSRFFENYRLDADHKVEKCSMFDAMMYVAHADIHIKKTTIDENCYVSTVFLGGCMVLRLPHGRVPRMFETMIFGGPLDGSRWLHLTWNEAEQDHSIAVARALVAPAKMIVVDEE